METGHYSYLTGRTARLVALAKARGMSESALARLPKVPQLVEPFVLRPKLATKRDATNFVNQAAQKALPPRKRNRKGHFERTPKPPRPFHLRWVKYEPRLDRAMPARVRMVVQACADSFDLSYGDLMSDARPQWIALPRFAVIRLLRVLLRLSFPSIGRVVSRDHSSCCHAFARCLHRRGHDLEFRRRYRAALLKLRSEGLTRK